MFTTKPSLRVAFVAYHFPPLGGGLSHRSLKYVKYLPQHGIEVEVLSGKFGPDAPWFDDRLLAEVSPDVPIHRVSDYTSSSLARRLRGRLVERLLRLSVRAVSHPDLFAGWARRAFRRLKRRHAERPFDAVFTTSFPWSAHRVGLKARAALGLRWVSDFRDPWTLNYEQRFAHPWLRALHRRMEKRVYDQSDHVVLNTPGNLKDVLRAFDLDPGKLSVIPNGFDPDDLRLTAPLTPPDDGRFHLLYLGGLRGDWFEAPFYRSLRALRETDPWAYRKLAVDFVGADRPQGGLCRQLRLGDVCRFHGFRPLGEVARWLAACDACALLLPATTDGDLGWVPQKTYTYLASGKPILFWGPRGSARDILGETRAGVHVEPKAVYHAAAVLAGWVRDHAAGRPPRGPSQHAVAAYDKRCLTQQLAEIFRDVCRRERPATDGPFRRAA